MDVPPKAGFNPERAPQAIEQSFSMFWHPTRNWFQSRTGSTGHLALIEVPGYNEVDEVSIPNGLHRPFSLSRRRATASPAWQFQSRTGSTGHLALFSYS